MMLKGPFLQKFVFDVCIVCYVLYFICVGTEFVDLTRLVLPVKRDEKCVFTYDRV